MKYNPAKFYMPDWLDKRPYQKPTQADYQLVNVCKEMLKLIFSNKCGVIREHLPDNVEKDLARYLVSYLEDIVSGLHVFQAFTSEHKRLYGKYLPFYELEDYYHDEINLEDVQFLIWYYLIIQNDKKKLISPGNYSLLDFAFYAHEILEKYYEYIPENVKLKEFLHIASGSSNYYDLRYVLGWFYLDSYLFQFNANILVDRQMEYIDEMNDYQDEVIIPEVMSNVQDHFLLDDSCSLLAYRASTWLSLVLGEKHPLYQSLKDLSKKKWGLYEYIKKTAKHVYFKHVATDTEIAVLAKTLNGTEDFDKPGSHWKIGFVNWKNEWWCTGMSFDLTWDADRVLDAKSSTEERSLFPGKMDQRLEMLEDQHKRFLKFNDNNLIYYFSNKNELNQFMKSWNDFYNNTQKKSKKQIEKSRKIFRKRGLDIRPGEPAGDAPDDTGFIFFNPSVGMEVITQDMSWFPDPENPFRTKDVEKQAFFTLLLDPVFSKELFLYQLRKKETLTLCFSGNPPDDSLHKNLDFMLRLWKYDTYFEEPKIFVV